jgi:hypothetical protein
MDTLTFVKISKHYKQLGFKGRIFEMYMEPTKQTFYFAMICAKCETQSGSPEDYTAVKSGEDYILYCAKCFKENKSNIKEI